MIDGAQTKTGRRSARLSTPWRAVETMRACVRSRLYSWFELETRTRTLLAELVQGWRAGGGPRRFVVSSGYTVHKEF